MRAEARLPLALISFKISSLKRSAPLSTGPTFMTSTLCAQFDCVARNRNFTVMDSNGNSMLSLFHARAKSVMACNGKPMHGLVFLCIEDKDSTLPTACRMQRP